MLSSRWHSSHPSHAFRYGGHVDLAWQNVEQKRRTLLHAAADKGEALMVTAILCRAKSESLSTMLQLVARVDDDGKITRLRRECPNETCGTGVFMATHFDRHYCGKCGLTYKQEK